MSGGAVVGWLDDGWYFGCFLSKVVGWGIKIKKRKKTTSKNPNVFFPLSFL
jgi:hypothetical protein